tara:strand:- start:247 stop:882 length:636 start_codon:yes stop_codon:yes gene_type:complete
MKSIQLCQVILVLFALAMFMMFTRSRENYDPPVIKNVGYEGAKVLLRMYVGVRRAVCTLAEDSENVDMAVETIYAQAVKDRNGSNECDADFKTDIWKTGMNKAIDSFNKRNGGPPLSATLGLPEIQIISAGDRERLLGAVGIFAQNCKDNDGKFTKGMIRENIMGFKDAMCSSRYYRKPGRFITAGQSKNMRENVKAAKLKNTPIQPPATE